MSSVPQPQKIQPPKEVEEVEGKKPIGKKPQTRNAKSTDKGSTTSMAYELAYQGILAYMNIIIYFFSMFINYSLNYLELSGLTSSETTLKQKKDMVVDKLSTIVEVLDSPEVKSLIKETSEKLGKVLNVILVNVKELTKEEATELIQILDERMKVLGPQIQSIVSNLIKTVVPPPFTEMISSTEALIGSFNASMQMIPAFFQTYEVAAKALPKGEAMAGAFGELPSIVGDFFGAINDLREKAVGATSDKLEKLNKGVKSKMPTVPKMPTVSMPTIPQTPLTSTPAKSQTPLTSAPPKLPQSTSSQKTQVGGKKKKNKKSKSKHTPKKKARTYRKKKQEIKNKKRKTERKPRK